MTAKWVLRIKERMKVNPLYWGPEGTAGCICKACGGKGRPVPIAAITNYGHEFDHCRKCGFKYVL